MAFRTDISIDWTVSPRIITIAAPSVTATIQDLSDTIRVLEGDRIWAMTREYILDNEGKFDLGAKLTGISLRLVDALLAFEARPGPTWAECTVSGGNLAAVDSGGTPVWPISFTDYCSVTFESDVSAALLKSDEIDTSLATIEAGVATLLVDVEFIKQIEGGRWKIDETANQMIFYEDDNATEVARFNLLDSGGAPTGSPGDAYERTRA
jgi:hypothetical protein